MTPARGPKGEAEDLQVTLADGRTYKAVVIGRSSLSLDIAVLHVFAPLEQMKPLPLGTARTCRWARASWPSATPSAWTTPSPPAWSRP